MPTRTRQPTDDAAPARPPAPPDWRAIRLWQIQPVRDLLVLGVVFGLLYLGYLLRPVTVPIMLALGLAYLFEPLVNRMTRSGQMRRPFAAAVIIAGVVLAVLVPLTIGGGFAMVQGARLSDTVGVNLSTLNKSLADPKNEELANRLPHGAWRSTRDFLVKLRSAEPVMRMPQTDSSNGAEPGSTTPPSPSTVAPDSARSASPSGGGSPPEQENPESSDQATPAQGWANYAIGWLRTNSPTLQRLLTQNVLGGGRDAAQVLFNILVSVFYFGFTLFLTLFFFFFFCSSWGRVKGQLVQMIPERNRERTVELLGMMNRVIAAFVRGRLVIALILLVLFSLGYWGIGVPAPLILGLIMGVMSIVPYLHYLGVPVAMVLLWLNPGAAGWQSEWWWILFAPLVLHWMVQNTDDYIWTPTIQGKATNLDMPTILFSVLAGGILAGIYGIIIAIPAAACLKIIIKEVLWPRFQSWSKGKAKDFLPISRS